MLTGKSNTFCDAFNNNVLYLVSEFNKYKIHYLIFWGASLLLRKLIKKTHDIDIITDKHNLVKIIGFLSKNKKVSNIVINIDSSYNQLTCKVGTIDCEFILLDSKSRDKDSYYSLVNKRYDTIEINRKKIKIMKIDDLLKLYKYVYSIKQRNKHLLRVKFLEKLTAKK